MSEEISEGSIVRYAGTGTVGTVKVLKTEDDGERWALLDSTGLYYHLSRLQPIDKLPERREIGARSLKEMEERMKAEEERMRSVKMEDESVESGG
ncbi:DUF2098 domain-containing protein [Methanotrichaceae archaeon M04Ac]|jgi:hypothetical protein|uniref:DUF2098 domain-containing protein n=1 Tax=Candidatus Methanocrinis alkalitolerans TaxID=3033395 RepID=A0ABT5XEB6_9EURY|nr:DUF2098 domain-containing protein [Candidatus Methanocrinis alkalitolerans]MCR3884574.1 DUF2098 domain-containing protein [Methanothrix sp.]MDF0593056.1 DUF2098 domain-containing protein [Candidatus Methanocrinis alkalitolerans]